jgi:hypothetical protein
MSETFRSKLAGARPPQVEFKTVKYRPAQEHLLRRLGEALVIQWDALPDNLQDLLIDQAAVVEDREEAPHATADIESFIRTARVVAAAKPTDPAAADNP